MGAMLLILALSQTLVVEAPRAGTARADEASVPPKILTRILPAYFDDTRNHLSGPETVLTVQLIVDNTGAVTSATAIEPGTAGGSLIDQTLTAVRMWRFEPGRLDGVTVPSKVTVIVKFANVRPAGRGGGPPGPLVLSPTLTVEGAEDDFEKGAFKGGEPGLTLPRERKFVEPKYPSSALRRKITGMVVLDVVVAPDGTVARARIKLPLDPDLDNEALSAVKKWRFEPGKKDGLPVPVLVTVEVAFKR